MNWPIPLDRLTDDTVTLRKPTDDDAVDVADAARDELSQKYTRVPEDYTTEQAVRYLRMREEDPNTVMWAIELASEPGRYAGNIEIRLVSTVSRTVTLAFTTAPWARRKGAMQRAIELAIDHAAACGVRRVEVSTIAANTATRMLLVRTGFVLEGVIQGGREHRGDMVDEALFSRDIEHCSPGGACDPDAA